MENEVAELLARAIRLPEEARAALADSLIEWYRERSERAV